MNTTPTAQHLTGTEKQIAWANDIKSQMIDSLSEIKSRTESRLAKGKNIDTMTQRLDAISKAENAINKITSAESFIQGRSAFTPSEIVYTLECVARWVNYKSANTQSDWDALYEQYSNHPSEQIGANQGNSRWFLFRDAI